MKLGKSLRARGRALIGSTMFAALPALAQGNKPNVVLVLCSHTKWEARH